MRTSPSKISSARSEKFNRPRASSHAFLLRYRLAMQLKKNIVVVKHEDFMFPDIAALPDDMKPIVK